MRCAFFDWRDEVQKKSKKQDIELAALLFLVGLLLFIYPVVNQVSSYHNGENDGEIVAVITSGKDGTAETPLLTWGEYQIAETRVPDDYLDDGYSVTVRIPAGDKAEETADPVK